MRKFSLSKLFVIVLAVCLCLLMLDATGVRAQTVQEDNYLALSTAEQYVITFSWTLPTVDATGAAVDPKIVQTDIFWRTPAVGGVTAPWKWIGGTLLEPGALFLDLTMVGPEVLQPHEYAIAFCRTPGQFKTWSPISNPVSFTMPPPLPAMTQTNTLTVKKK